MLRITETLENPQAVRLKLAGTLSRETYEDFEQVFLGHHAGSTKMIVLDMQGVTFLHEGAARKLARVGGARVRLVNCSPFIQTLLEAVRRQD
jgi:anti-anti-sigma regulatory factor